MMHKCVQVPAQHVAGLAAEHGGGSFIHEGTAAFPIKAVDALARRLQEQADLLRQALPLFLYAFALDQLADLAADGREQLQHVVIGGKHVAAEALDDAEDCVSEQDGERKGSVPPLSGGTWGTRKVGILGRIGSPDGLATGPDAAG